MKFRPEFKRNNPESKEEKLICEYIDNLNQTSIAHINMNKAQFNDHEIFITLRDGAIGFAGSQIKALLKIMADKSQIGLFLEECEGIFKRYLTDAMENIK